MKIRAIGTMLSAGSLLSVLLLAGCGATTIEATPTMWEQSFIDTEAPVQILVAEDDTQVSRFSRTDAGTQVQQFDLDGNPSGDFEIGIDLGASSNLLETRDGVLWYGKQGLALFDANWNLAWEHDHDSPEDIRFEAIFLDDSLSEIVYGIKDSSEFQIITLFNGQVTNSHGFSGDNLQYLKQLTKSNGYIYAFLTQYVTSSIGSLYVFDSDFNQLNKWDDIEIASITAIPGGVVYANSSGLFAIDEMGNEIWSQPQENSSSRFLLATKGSNLYLRTFPNSWANNGSQMSVSGPYLKKLDFNGEEVWTYFPTESASATFTVHDSLYYTHDFPIRELANGNVVLSYRETTDQYLRLIDKRFIARNTHHLISADGEQLRKVIEKTDIEDLAACLGGKLCPSPVNFKPGHTTNYGVLVTEDESIISLSQQTNTESEDFLTELSAY